MAHRLDEYLQATLVSIEPGVIRLKINLTPGVEVADHVLDRLDRNHDGLISTNEAAAYCESLKRDLVARLDQHKGQLQLNKSNFPIETELRTGWGIIQIEFTLRHDPLTPGPHIFSLKNRHLRTLSVYLFNAAQPDSGLVHITAQKRNKNQSYGKIEFTIQRAEASRIPRMTVETAWKGVWFKTYKTLQNRCRENTCNSCKPSVSNRAFAS